MGKVIEYIKNIIIYIRGDRRLSFIVLGIVIALVLIVLGRIKPPETETPPDTNFRVQKEEQIIWEETGAIPGVSKYGEVKKEVEGKYEGSEKYHDYRVHKYLNLDAFHDTIQIGVDRDQIVKYVQVTITPYKLPNVSDYINRFDLDSPDIIKDVKDLNHYEAWVYLDEGVMYYVNKLDRNVYSEMYFDPMNRKEFKVFWEDSNLTDEFQFPEDYK
ncbi:hypothetical protein ACFL0C_00090 [Patescibacteria group bacterium]